MKKITTIYRAILFASFKMRGLRITSYFALLFTIMFISGCTKTDQNGGSEGGGGSATGVWQRYDSPNGYNTDLAVGDIPGEPSNRVYMCEHPGSPSAGLYKGYINGDIITWDQSHGLPDAEFKVVGGERTLYFGVGAPEDAGKYKKGIWTNTCGELKKTSKQIYYSWTHSASCTLPSNYSLMYKHPDLPSSLTKKQIYGPISAGSVEITFNYSGSTPTLYYIFLAEPPTGYKRIYTHSVMEFENSLNRCIMTISSSNQLTYVDQPL